MLIDRGVMEARACLFILLTYFARSESNPDCFKLTFNDNKVLGKNFFNNTAVRPPAKNKSASVYKYNVLELWDNFPKIVVPANGTSEQCRRDSDLFRTSLHNLEIWALKMFDATAKLPSGILSGNGNQYGDFDECLGVDGPVAGKYCLASLQLTLGGDDRMDRLDHLVHSGHYIRSNLTDLGHRVPRYSSILWGVCIPSSCSSYDLEDELTQRLSVFGVTVKVHNTMCSVRNSRKTFSFGKSLSIAFFLTIALCLTVGTIFDDGSEGTTTFEKILTAFSLRRNLRKLLDTSETQDRVKGIDAIRGLNALALLAVHKSMAMAHNAYTNKTHFAEVFGMPWAVLGRSAVVYTDSFLYLSGFLNAKNLIQEIERNGTIDVKRRLIARWFRLFPLFLSLMLFCTYILPELNSGPQWNLVVGEHSRVCKKNMWKSFFFIHNYFGFENMCLTHTHQLGMDMQLYVATLPLILLLNRHARLGWVAVTALAVGSTALRYLSVYWHDISMFVYYGITVQNLLDAAKYCYILPTHRATVYLMGVAMAYFFNSKRSKFTLSKIQTPILWASCLFLCLFTIISPWRMGLTDYKFENYSPAIFGAFSSIMWGIFLCAAHWGICNNHAGIFGDIVESRPFKLLNKIAYGVYLTQFPIFFYNVGVQRHSGYYSPFSVFSIPEVAVVLIISTLTTVTIEMPFNEVYRILFGKPQNKLKNK